VPVAQPGAVQGLITNTYLSPAECDLLASHPAMVLTKTRLSVPPLGVVVFDGHLQGLILAEGEFAADEEAQSFVPLRSAWPR
jgi:CYTH domain-containing protein